MSHQSKWAYGLGGLLSATAIVHFAAPQVFDGIVPGWLPGTARMWTYISGGAEAGVAALVLNPSTRRMGGYSAAALFLAVFPANIKMSLDAFHDHESGIKQAASIARLPLQIPLVLWGLRVARRAGS